MPSPSFQIQHLTEEQNQHLKEAQIELKRVKLLHPHNQPVPHEESALRQSYKGIPIIGGLLGDLTELGRQLADGTPVGDKAGQYMPLVGLLSRVANLFRIGALIKDAEKKGVPFEMNNYKKAKFTYTVIALTLGILIFVFPQIAAGFFVASACLGLVASIVTLSKTHWKRYKERQEIKEIEKNQPAMEERMQEITNELDIKGAKLFHIHFHIHFGSHEKADISAYIKSEKEAILKLGGEYEGLNQKLSRKTELKAKFERKKDKFFDKHVGVPFALLGVIAAIIGLSNPVLGLILGTMGIVTGIGVALMVYAIWPKVIKPLYNMIAGLFGSKENSPTATQKPSQGQKFEITNQFGALAACSIEQHQQTLALQLQREPVTNVVTLKPDALKKTITIENEVKDTETKGEIEDAADEEGSGDNETPKI